MITTLLVVYAIVAMAVFDEVFRDNMASREGFVFSVIGAAIFGLIWPAIALSVLILWVRHLILTRRAKQ